MLWGSGLQDPRDQDRRRNPWHNDSEYLEDGRERVVSGDAGSDSSSPDGTHRTGTWGEPDAGRFDPTTAAADIHTLREELATLSRTRSQNARSERHHDGLMRNISRKSTHRSVSRQESRVSHTQTSGSTAAEDEETADAAVAAEKEDDFELSEFMKEGYFEKRKDGKSAKKVGVVWKGLNVKGVGSTATFVKTVPDAILGTFGPDLYRLITRFIPALRLGRHQQTRTLIHDFSGVLKDGEMMLVLGRPGSGCSTFLKAIANNRESYAAVEGEVSYGGISAEKQAKQFRGEVNYNEEDDIHFANLNVWQTLTFALTNKTRKNKKEEIPIILDALLRMFGISHTKYTPVGDEYVRGVSGGERKRVSIAETLAAKSTVVCWDNSTRGLDASTALDYAKSLRIMTDLSNRTTFVTLYQAGEGIYEQMDKVMVIDQGRCIYEGPAKEAKQYFLDLGFHCPERQTTADFLTAVTDPTERQFREGCENSAPKTPEDLEKAFRSSKAYQKIQKEIATYEEELKRTDYIDAKEFEGAVAESKSNSKLKSKKSPFTVSFVRQVLACTKREFWLTWGDKTTLYTKFFIIISNGLIVGSLFYGQSMDTSGAFTRSGTAFFSILFLGWLQLSELMKAVSGREVVKRHEEYAFYRPSAVSLARVLQDIPLLLAQVIPFSIIMYFMTGLDADAGKFWIFFLFIYTTTFCITSLYRMFAAMSPTIDDAVRFAGLALNILIVFTGYVIPKPQLLSKYIWFGWLFHINPIAYSFEAVLTNEFSNRVMDCAPSQLVPQGPGVDPQYQGCSLTGAQPNSNTVSGASYLQTSFEYTRSHLWRNWGVVIAFSVVYLIVTVWATEFLSFAKGGGGALVFKKSQRTKKAVKEDTHDEEKGAVANPSGSSLGEGAKEEEALASISSSESVFTWKDVEYTVPYQGGERKLLNKVNGYAKPGVMIALVGASGAGKSTLLNTLSQRQSTGVVSGEMFVDGKDLGKAFQRGTGFCEQMDLHDGTATIREALEFSAILRQDNKIPRQEKLDYVDKVIDLLELQDVQDALVSSLGVEQKKRVTIGVELAAKPSLLLFLDEPTSGLDSNSAYSIVTFLKKLAAAGQAIVCTIHQPSSVLIQQFDMILALK